MDRLVSRRRECPCGWGVAARAGASGVLANPFLIQLTLLATLPFLKADESQALGAAPRDQEAVPQPTIALYSVITSYSIHYTKLYDTSPTNSLVPP